MGVIVMSAGIGKAVWYVVAGFGRVRLGVLRSGLAREAGAISETESASLNSFMSAPVGVRGGPRCALHCLLDVCYHSHRQAATLESKVLTASLYACQSPVTGSW